MSVPPEGWRYLVSQTGFMVTAPNWPALYPAIQTHCESNGVPVPSEDEVIVWVCQSLTVPCREGKDAYANNFVNMMPVRNPNCCKSTKK